MRARDVTTRERIKAYTYATFLYTFFVPADLVGLSSDERSKWEPEKTCRERVFFIGKAIRNGGWFIDES